MIEYLIESTFCGAALYLAFMTFFRRSRNFQVNRVILLCSVLFFVLAPLAHLSLNSEMIANETVASTLSGITNVSSETLAATESLNTTGNLSILFPLYILVVTILLGRMSLNLYSILTGKFVVERTEYKGHKLALVDIPVSPFSFLKTVYLNKESFEKDEIDDELILHESGHIKQRHTLDILFIELVQVFCWFNPFVFLFKKLIQTNHEYLADEFVIYSGSDKTQYSNKLINYTTRDKTFALASGFNYSLIKNRLIMLSKYDQKNRIAHRLALFSIIISGLFVTTAFTNPDPVIKLTENSGHFYADTLWWSSETQKVYLRGNVDIQVGDNDVNGNGSFSFLGQVNLLVIDGTPAKMDEAILVSGKKCEILILSEEKARQQFGDDGKLGAVVIKKVD